LTGNRKRARRGGSSGRGQGRRAVTDNRVKDDPALAHFGRTVWPSDRRRSEGNSAARPGPDVDPDEDRRGNLVSPRKGGDRAAGEAHQQERPRRRRRQGGRRRKGDRPETAAARPGEESTAQAEAPGLRPGQSPELRPGPDPAAVVRGYLDAVQESRTRAHEAHRRVAEALGTPRLVKTVEDWGRRWTGTGRKETILGKPTVDGDEAVVETTGEGFGPVRYRLSRAEDVWRIDAVAGACPDCDRSGHCSVCSGGGCDACNDGSCPACKGDGWVAYRK
jgi:hypothetical protein